MASTISAGSRKSSELPGARPAGRAEKPGRRARVAGGAARKIRSVELPMFSRQLSAMLSSGMPVVQTLQALEEQTSNKLFKPVIQGIRTQIEGGAAFSDAIGRYPEIFDELYVGLIRSGEQGGVLAETAGRVADYLEASSKLRRKVKAAMAYPTVVIIVALLLAAGMITFVVPKFAGMFTDFGAKLPAPTQFLVDAGNFMKKYLLLVLAAIIVVVVLFKRWLKTPSGIFKWDRFLINLPVLGMLNRKVGVSRFASTFAQLMHSGVPILKGLEIVATATGNKVLGKVLLDARAVVERGEPLSSALAASKQYPPIVVHMLAAGEKTGKMEDMLEKISEFYDSEVDATLTSLTSMMEPLLMVFLGVIIGGIVICMFLPIFKMSEVINF